MSAIKTIRKLIHLLGVALLLGPISAFAGYDALNMPESVTQVGKDIYDLHMLVFWIVTVVGIAVFAVIIYSIIYHRKSKGAVAATFHESATVELIWTIIPFVILVAIAVPATKTLLAIEDTSNSDITIKATGWQWKWQYDYVDDKVADSKGLSFFSSLDKASEEARQRGANIDLTKVDNYLLNVDEPIKVPVGKKVRILTTSNDVIHAWWVPDLAIKRDAIPGFINESWFRADKEGVYRGQCAELCGKDHGFMPIVVEVVSEAKYKQWVSNKSASLKKASAAAAAASSKTWSKAELMARGKEVYMNSCAACHQANGAGLGPFPALKGSKVATTGPVSEHIAIVKNGKNAMPPFGAQLSAADIAAVVTYERNEWGNNTGDVVQPSQVSR